MTSLVAVWGWVSRSLKRAWTWLLANPVALAAAAGGVVGAYFMWKSRENQVASLEDAVAIQATKTKIAKAQAEAELLEQQSDALDPRVVELKKVITDSKRRVLELNKDAALNELSDADIARRFSESGL